MNGQASHDVVVIGAGHNGLVAAAYLARAGLQTVLVEARSTVGGCASTVDAIGGRVNVCNCDHLWVRGTAIVEELELESHGLEYLDLDPCYASIGWSDEKPWLLYHDLDRTLEGLSTSHPHQVDAYRRHIRAMLPAARLLKDVTNGTPTPGRVASLGSRHPGAAARVLKLARRSAVDALRSHFDDEELVRPALTTGPVVWGVDPTMPGTGLAAIGYAAKHLTPVGRPRGGSGAFTDAIHAAYTAAGGTTVLGRRVTRIETSSAGPVAVVLDDGSRLGTRTVVTATDPHDALTGWIDDDRCDEIRRNTADVAPVSGYESKIDAFVSEPPRYVAMQRAGLEEHATVIVSPSVQQMREAHALMQRNAVAEHPMFITNCPSTLDPSMADAAGNDLLSLEVLWTPIEAALDWSTSTEPSRWIAKWGELIEQDPDDLIERKRIMTPDRYESEFSMRRGHAPSFAGTPWSAVRGRPAHLTRSRSPVPGVYLSGAATYPGAGIWGAPGRNAARTVLRDAKIRLR